MRVLVTGSDGFIGRRVCKLLEPQHEVVACDEPDNILSAEWVKRTSGDRFDRCIHLAANKYATVAEDYPEDVADLNIRGTANVVRAAGCPVVLASTCKAADPCTVYGASKLIAERIVLNAGGTVVRLVNVLGSTGSVLDIWDHTDGPLPVINCKRMWIEADQAVKMFVDALALPSGRYGPLVDPPTTVASLADIHYPDRGLYPVPLRRGDRPVERLVGEYESLKPWDGQFVRIFDKWEDRGELPEGSGRQR